MEWEVAEIIWKMIDVFQSDSYKNYLFLQDSIQIL